MKGILHELALFAGLGGGLLATHSLGIRTVCAIEIDPFCQSLLLTRQNEGILPPFPIWDDVRTFEGRDWRGHVDLVSGGFPCQDISSAGRGGGLGGEKSGLWWEMARIIEEVQPAFVFLENSPLLRTRGLAAILAFLADQGFDADWTRLGAWEVGAPHKRDRLWLLAVSRSVSDAYLRRLYRALVSQPAGRLHSALACGGVLPDGGEACAAADVSNPHRPRCQGDRHLPDSASESESKGERSLEPSLVSRQSGGAWEVEPSLCRVVDGDARRMDDRFALRALGNGQVPQVARRAFLELFRRLGGMT